MAKRKLVLENGLVFIGNGFGSDKEVIAELVFNTSVEVTKKSCLTLQIMEE